MYINEVKTLLEKPDYEYIIDKTINIKGELIKLLSITKEKGEYILRTFEPIYNNKYKNYIDEDLDLKKDNEYYEKFKSDYINLCDYSTDISEIRFEDIKIDITTSTYEYFYTSEYFNNINEYTKFIYFLNLGIDFSNFMDKRLEDYKIVKYKLNYDLDISNKKLTSLITRNSFIRRYVNQDIILDLENNDSDKKYTYIDLESKKEKTYYINNVRHYNILEDAENKFSSKEMKEHFKEEQLLEMKENYLKHIGKICEEDKDLILIEYESEDDIQLNFCAKDFVQEQSNMTRVKNNVTNGSYGISIMLMNPIADKKIGNHGLANRLEILRDCNKNPINVTKDFNNKISCKILDRIEMLEGKEFIL